MFSTHPSKLLIQAGSMLKARCVQFSWSPSAYHYIFIAALNKFTHKYDGYMMYDHGDYDAMTTCTRPSRSTSPSQRPFLCPAKMYGFP